MSTLVTKKRVVTFIIILFAITGLTACKDGARDKDKHMGMFFDYMAYKLDFTPEQERILDRIQTQVKTIKAESREQRAASKQAFVALIEADELDTDQLQSMMDNHQQRMEQHAPKIMPLLAELHATLTPEQKSKIIERLNKHEED